MAAVARAQHGPANDSRIAATHFAAAALEAARAQRSRSQEAVRLLQSGTVCLRASVDVGSGLLPDMLDVAVVAGTGSTSRVRSKQASPQTEVAFLLPA